MRLALAGLAIALVTGALHGQPSGKWPPDSLVNTHVIPRNTPVIQVVGMMRDFAAGLGVRCQFSTKSSMRARRGCTSSAATSA